MSFNDVARQRQQNVPQPIVRSSNSVSSSSKSNINVDPLSQISDSLQNIQVRNVFFLLSSIRLSSFKFI